MRTSDYKKFDISSTGLLTFVSEPDFDSPGDMGKDNVYNVTVVASGTVRTCGRGNRDGHKRAWRGYLHWQSAASGRSFYDG